MFGNGNWKLEMEMEIGNGFGEGVRRAVRRDVRRDVRGDVRCDVRRDSGTAFAIFGGWPAPPLHALGVVLVTELFECNENPIRS